MMDKKEGCDYVVTNIVDAIEWKFTKQQNPDTLDKKGLFEFTSLPWKKHIEDDIERYNIIKDLGDHIVSSSRLGPSQDSASPSKEPQATGHAFKGS